MTTPIPIKPEYQVPVEPVSFPDFVLEPAFSIAPSGEQEDGFIIRGNDDQQTFLSNKQIECLARWFFSWPGNQVPGDGHE